MQNKPASLKALIIMILAVVLIIPAANLSAQNPETKIDTTSRFVLPFDSIPIAQKKKVRKNGKTSGWVISLDGIRVFRFHQFDNELMKLPEEFFDYYKEPLGLSIKLKTENPGAFRLKLFYNYNSSRKTENNIRSDVRKSTYKSKTSFGYEWHKIFQKTQIFYGADIIRSNFKQTEKNFRVPSYPAKEVVYQKIYLGISPLIGVEYFITKKLSLATEISFNIQHYKENYKENKKEGSGFEMSFGPLGIISVNIHL